MNIRITLLYDVMPCSLSNTYAILGKPTAPTKKWSQNIPLSQLPISPRINGFTCQKKFIIISQKLQEEVHKFRPGKDH